jgi:hypothetical protein
MRDELEDHLKETYAEIAGLSSHVAVSDRAAASSL